jgi:hypothetical protein
MTRHKRSNTRTSSSVAGAIHLGAAILSVAANLRRRCRFRRLFLTTDCVHQHLISAFLLHAPPAFPCLVSLLCSLAHHLQPKGPLDEVSASSIKGWLQDAVNSKKPVLILFAPAGHSLIEQLGKIKKNDEVKMAKFGHVAANDDSHPLMKKFKIKRLPAVLLGSKGDPSALNR